jgi:hypothetical protein
MESNGKRWKIPERYDGSIVGKGALWWLLEHSLGGGFIIIVTQGSSI